MSTSSPIDRIRSAWAAEESQETCDCFACKYGAALIDVAEAAQEYREATKRGELVAELADALDTALGGL